MALAARVGGAIQAAVHHAVRPRVALLRVEGDMVAAPGPVAEAEALALLRAADLRVPRNLTPRRQKQQMLPAPLTLPGGT